MGIAWAGLLFAREIVLAAFLTAFTVEFKLTGLRAIGVAFALGVGIGSVADHHQVQSTR